MSYFFFSFVHYVMLLATGSTGSITAEITDIKSTQGPIIVMLFNSEEGFPREPQKAFKRGKITAYGKTAKYTFTNVPFGKYAIAVFQDKDGDGEIDTNFMGMPRESVGASNLMKMGRPVYEKCTFPLAADHITIKLKFIL